MDDDQIVRKAVKNYLDVIIGTKLSEGHKVILLPCLSVSTYMSVLHYQPFLGISQFTHSAIFLSLFSHSQFTPSAIIHPQSVYIISYFIHSVI
jgi:hypothetical protein